MTSTVKTFLNLTNGLEFLSKGINFDGFLRIQSTHLEQKKYDEVIANLDSNFLMWVSLGEDCFVLDCGSRRCDGNPRSLHTGIELVKYFLNKRWFNCVIETERNHKHLNHFKSIKLNRKSKRKIDYFKTFIPDNINCVNVDYDYDKSKNDYDKSYHRDLILKWKHNNDSISN